MIYLDYQATTPLAPEALAAMQPWLASGFANPHSPHRLGRAAAAAVDVARDQVAALLPPGGRVIFTSGASEAINLAIKGSLASRPRPAIAASAIEHAAVLDTARFVARSGAFHALPVGGDGVVAPDAELPEALDLLAVMHVNNEIGTIQPIADLAARAQAKGALFLCDAVQSYGRIAIPHGPDMIALSAHKIHGPKGIGALWVREGVELEPLIHGGGQEQGLRSGTLSPALCAGFGAAAALAARQSQADADHVEALWRTARAAFAGWTLNGDADRRYHGNMNLRREGLDVARLMSNLRDIAFSAGSACASGSGRTSHVLSAIGLTSAQAKNCIRLGFGRYTSADDVESAAEMINAAADAQI